MRSLWARRVTQPPSGTRGRGKSKERAILFKYRRSALKRDLNTFQSPHEYSLPSRGAGLILSPSDVHLAEPGGPCAGVVT